MADNGGLQLLPEIRRKIDIRTPGQNKLLFFSLGFLVLLFALYGGLLIYKNSLSNDLAGVEQQLAALEQSRNKSEEMELLRLKDQLGIIKPLIESHIIWSEGLTRIQNLVNPQVQFDSLNANVSKGEYSFKALAASYAAIAKQIAAFYGDEAITDVNLGKIANLPTGRVEFSMQLNLDINKFLKKNLPKVRGGK